MLGSFMIMATTPPCCFAFAPLLRVVARALAGDLVAFLAGELVLAPSFAACFLVFVFPRLPAAFFFVVAWSPGALPPKPFTDTSW